MNYHLSNLFKACKIVLSDIRYLLAWFLLTILFFLLLVYLPVSTIPGNSLAFQLSIFTTKDFVLLALLSLLTSLSLVLNSFAIIRQFTAQNSFSLVAQGGGGGVSGLIASVFGTASCSACVGSLFGFLGFGTVLFLLQYRYYIVGSAVILLLISLIYTSQKVLGICKIKVKKSQ